MKRVPAVLCAVCFAALASEAATAGLFRAYLSVNGNDANPCTVSQPCRLLPAALAAVNDGGEVWMLDSANYNVGKVTVGKSVTILAIPGALGTVVANNDAAILINGSGISVTLRNLNVRNFAGSGNTGIWVANVSRVAVEDCEVYGLSIGIYSQMAGTISAIKGTTVRDSVTGIRSDAANTITIEHSTILGDSPTYGVYIQNGAHLTMTTSTVSGHGVAGVEVIGAPYPAYTTVAIADSSVSWNGKGVYATGPGASGIRIQLTRTLLDGNGSTGVHLDPTQQPFVFSVDLDQTTISNSAGAGVMAASACGPTCFVYSAQNNAITNVTTPVSGISLTPRITY